MSASTCTRSSRTWFRTTDSLSVRLRSDLVTELGMSIDCRDLQCEKALDKSLIQSKEFFDLFVDFRGYVDFFLLQDCVDERYNVRFWLNTPLFVSNPLPQDLESYLAWVDTQLDFAEKRNWRIKNYIMKQ